MISNYFNSMKSQKFRTYANQNARIATFGGMAILLLCIGVPLIFTPTEEISWSWFGLIPLAIFGFFVYVILSASLKLLITYQVSEHGILISKPLFHRRFIPIDTIEDVILMNEEGTQKLMENEVFYQQWLKDSGDLHGLFQKIKKESPYYLYLTITPRGTSAGEGQAETVTSVNISAQMVLLILKNGEKFFLSPQNIKTFYDLVVKITKG